MSQLDVNTPKGQQAEADILPALLHYERLTGFKLVSVDKHGAARTDGRAYRGNELVLLYEAKTRYCTQEHFFGPKPGYEGVWLLSDSKISRLEHLCIKYQVVGFGFLYLKYSRILIPVPLVFANGARTCRLLDVRHSLTQRSCNGGLANRLNAYIDVRDCPRLLVP